MNIIKKEKNVVNFQFGKNWSDYIKTTFSLERLEISKTHLLKFLKLENLKRKTFVDVGCGSGLHSLAAFVSGAENILSFDLDPDSVATTKCLWEIAGRPRNWIIRQESVLDKSFLKTISSFDIVYSWGVLHHTGDMWQAVRNVANLLSPSGVLYLALYSKEAYVSPPSEFWVEVKKKYNKSSYIKKIWMEWCYAWNDSIYPCLKNRKNPWQHLADYKHSRGMSYWHDVKDWLGGYPIEFAGNQETELFLRDECKMQLIHRKAGEGNTEYLFCPKEIPSYWDKIIKKLPKTELQGPFEHLGGFAWRTSLSDGWHKINYPDRFMLYEDDSPIGWPKSPLSSVQYTGKGRYIVQGEQLIFSATDNSNPNESGKKYAFRPDFL